MTKDQEVYNKGNEWLEYLRGNSKVRPKAVRTQRLNTRYVSRAQRGAVVGEKDGQPGTQVSNAQREVVKGGK